MKVKTVVQYGVEKRKELVGAATEEFWRKIREEHLSIANPKLRQCWAVLQFDQASRGAIAKITDFRTDPEDLDDEYDRVVYKRRLERIHDQLDTPEGRQQIVEALESGTVSLTLNMKEMPTFDDQTALCVRLGYTDANGEKHLCGVE